MDFSDDNSLQYIRNSSQSEDKNEEDNLLQGINSYRQSLNMPALSKNDKAGYLADEIADQLEHQPCMTTTSPITTASSSRPQITNFPDLLEKCNIDINTTRDGVIILPVCVPKLIPTLVLTNYTQSQFSRYVNNSKYTRVGIGSEDDWMVVVLTTNTPTRSFFSAADMIFEVGLSRCLMFLL
ncbi:LOW QUALITY PROTEIN: uncharacterized GPI-anchored protein At3g06035 [Camellia sinensis]|uniref:LOW QUALITY PROTEIN: uncharacterized GPI-anchored protein At3g06035 n=1 Tax=Camellia sinensis TaxID=4442 RepID=UPI00103654DE|nr:LOW QUALITY PROTEIN: uncharacterized GPI-anchored protein At3g06035 [Camellia sinensis]